MKVVKPAAPSAPSVAFERADKLFDLDVNPILKKAGVESFPRFVQLLEGYLKGIPELHQIAKTADKHGAKAVLSGGSARAILVALLKDIEKTGGQNPKPNRSLFDMMEGSDIDVLVMGKDGKPLPKDKLDKLQKEMNRVSGAQLVDPLPSSQRRLYAAEWDVVEAFDFAALNAAFGGETPSLMGFGLDAKGGLTLYDPEKALTDIFAGSFRYVAGEKGYEHDMVVTGKFDPSLDGLRIIRMAGQMKEVGVDLGAQAIDSLNALGAEANRRGWEVQARFLHSPDAKLQRRWAKYAKKIWIDHKDPAYARQLLEQSGYLDVLTTLGLRKYALHEVPAEKPRKVDAHPLAQQIARAHAPAFANAEKPGDQVQAFAWMPTRLAELAVDEKRPFGADESHVGPGLQFTAGEFPEGAIVTTQVKVELNADARLLDLSQPEVANAVDELVPLVPTMVQAQNDSLTPLGMSESARSIAIAELVKALGLDGAVQDNGDGAIMNKAAIAAMTRVKGLDEGVIQSLQSKQAGVNKEHAVRALLASQGAAGFATLDALLTNRAVTVGDLFPADAQKGGLFADVPFVDPGFAARLATHAMNAKDLTDAQRANVAAAVAYLRAELPAEFTAVPTAKGA